MDERKDWSGRKNEKTKMIRGERESKITEDKWMNKEKDNRIDSFTLIGFLFQPGFMKFRLNGKFSQMPEYGRDLGETLCPFLSL